MDDGDELAGALTKSQDELRAALAGQERLMRLLEEAASLMESAKRMTEEANARADASRAELQVLQRLIDENLAWRSPARAA